MPFWLRLLSILFRIDPSKGANPPSEVDGNTIHTINNANSVTRL